MIGHQNKQGVFIPIVFFGCFKIVVKARICKICRASKHISNIFTLKVWFYRQYKRLVVGQGLYKREEGLWLIIKVFSMHLKQYIIMRTPGRQNIFFRDILFINDLINFMIIHVSVKVHILSPAAIKIGGV